MADIASRLGGVLARSGQRAAPKPKAAADVGSTHEQKCSETTDSGQRVRDSREPFLTKGKGRSQRRPFRPPGTVPASSAAPSREGRRLVTARGWTA